ncbi:MAG TPA: lysophospholipid acyltransferase family protein [Rhodocyclaceae bacterium]|nr:lysophospholipid acyltransferase family protein [Rhodocyclaceae bacterium]
MNLLRSAFFTVILTLVTVPYAVLAMLTWPLPPQARYRIITGWSVIAMWFIRYVLGIQYRVIGRENLPAEPAVILCKHQSAWETIALQRIFPPVAFVLKRELLLIPFFGWGLARMPIISINRNAGKDALNQVIDQGKERLAEGFWVVVFPEGTRSAPGSQKRYKIGGASLAVSANARVVPVAHNAGEFWRRNAFVKQPGDIVVSIGPVIETMGRSAEEVNQLTEAWIESEMRRLFPHHFSDNRIPLDIVADMDAVKRATSP